MITEKMLTNRVPSKPYTLLGEVKVNGILYKDSPKFQKDAKATTHAQK